MRAKSTAIGILLLALPALAQPKFGVASIKPCNAAPAAPNGGKKSDTPALNGPIHTTPGSLHEECQTVETIIRDAFLAYADGKPWHDAGIVSPNIPASPPLSNRQIHQPLSGAPAWTATARYTIDAKAATPASEELMRGPMMQSLLRDRFHLELHRESREVRVYELTVAPGGAKLQPYREGSCIPFDTEVPPAPREPGQPLPRLCGFPVPNPKGGTDINGVTLAAICRGLSTMADRDVLDKTGLTGLYDIHLDTRPPAPPADPQAAPNPQADRYATFLSLREAFPKLGLTLAPAKSPADFLIVDRIQRPTGN